MASKILEIPIMHCFNDQYAVPASVAFLSLLEHASRDCFYALYVIHSDITCDHQRMLTEIVERFENASLTFLEIKDQSVRLFDNVTQKAHYTPELMHKLTVPNLFPQYSRMIVTDVDCQYFDDISKSYIAFLNDSENYIAGIGWGRSAECDWLNRYYESCYSERFSPAEMACIRDGIGAGYMIYNLDLMRCDGIVDKLLSCFQKNAYRIQQPEQDVLNLVCHGRIHKLPNRDMVCTYLYDQLPEEKKLENEDALMHPVQLHYAAALKPWLRPACQKSHLWWTCFARTPFFYEYMRQFKPGERKRNYSFFGKIPFLEIWGESVSNVRLARFLRLKEVVRK